MLGRANTHKHTWVGIGTHHRGQSGLENSRVGQLVRHRRSCSRVLDIHRDNVRDECDGVGDQVFVLAHLHILHGHLRYWQEHPPVHGLDRELLLRGELGGEC